MKKTRTIAVMAAMVAIFLANPGRASASSNDTLVVYASGPTLDQVINNDTTSGTQAHLAYKLVSLDTTYLWLGPITVKSNFEVLGVLGSNGRPPCIQSSVLGDGSLPYYLFVINGPHTVATFKNLYLTGLAINNTINALNVNGIGSFIQVAADSVKLYVDNVIFEDMPDECIGYTGNWDDLFITNCKFRNLISATQWFSGEAVRNTNNAAITDSIVMHDNTFLAMNCYDACPVTLSFVKYLDFQHNSDVMTFQNPFWIFNVTTAKIDNNMFYGTWLGGITYIEYLQFWDELLSLEYPSVIDLDTLAHSGTTAGTIAKMFDPQDSGSSNFLWLAEAKRQIEVKNNNFYEPDTVIGFWKAYDDTAHGDDSLISPVWMNARTTHMFNDPSQWPGLVQSGNLNVDPEYGSSFVNMLYNNMGDGVGEFQYLMDIRGNVASTDIYGYQLQNASSGTWIPQWPLPELQDMQYTNASLKTGGTDGKPVGDDGWFTGGYTGVKEGAQQLPAQFTLSEAYPNPFNPSAHIDYTVPRAGYVTLKVYNVLGQEVATLFSGAQQPGKYVATFDGTRYASGVYFYRVQAGSVSITKKMVLMK
ncbi:MAG: T9SS type A sorting domain-containing protein [Candidatus Kryptoniota bacterium]